MDTEGDRRREIEAELTSGEPTRTRRALHELDDSRRRGQDVSVTYPGPQIIDLVGPGPGEDDLLAFCRLVRDPGAFVPALPWRDGIRIAVDAMLRHGGGQSAHDVAMGLKLDQGDPVGAAREAIWWIWERGLHSRPERQAAARFVSYLLEGRPEVRDATLRALRPWAHETDFAYVVTEVLPELSEQERAALVDDDS